MASGLSQRLQRGGTKIAAPALQAAAFALALTAFLPLVLSLFWAGPLLAQEDGRTVPFTGRLVDEHGQAVAGSVDLQLNFFAQPAEGQALLPEPLLYPKTSLADGVFTVPVHLSAAALALVFPDPERAIFLQVKDATHSRVYQRQRFRLPAVAAATPAPPVPPPASAIPVLGVPAAAAIATAAEPLPQTPDAALLTAASAACFASPVAGGKFLVPALVPPNVPAPACAAACTAAEPATTCLRGWTLYADDRYFEIGDECTVAVQAATVQGPATAAASGTAAGLATGKPIGTAPGPLSATTASAGDLTKPKPTGRLCCCLNTAVPTTLVKPPRH